MMAARTGYCGTDLHIHREARFIDTA